MNKNMIGKNYWNFEPENKESKKILKQTGKLVKAKEFSKEIIYVRGFCITMKDAHGQVIYMFNDKKKADQFFKELTKK